VVRLTRVSDVHKSQSPLDLAQIFEPVREDLARVDFMIGPRAFGQTLGKKVGSLPLWRDDPVTLRLPWSPPLSS